MQLSILRLVKQHGLLLSVLLALSVMPFEQSYAAEQGMLRVYKLNKDEQLVRALGYEASTRCGLLQFATP